MMDNISIEEMRAKMKVANYATKQEVEVTLRRLLECHEKQLNLAKELQRSTKARCDYVRDLLNVVMKSY